MLKGRKGEKDGGDLREKGPEGPQGPKSCFEIRIFDFPSLATHQIARLPDCQIAQIPSYFGPFRPLGSFLPLASFTYASLIVLESLLRGAHRL